jgi:hypothetical protein
MRISEKTEKAALIAWMLVVRVGNLVKDRRPPKAAALRAVLDKIINTNNPASMRSRPPSDQEVAAFAKGVWPTTFAISG